MDRRRLASRVLRVVGFVLLAVAGIHLSVTSVLRQTILDRVLTDDMLPIVAPPFVLNHVVVGLLLIPLGLVTIYGAAGVRAGERWAWVISWFVGASLMTLPVALVLIMRGGMFDALPFRVAEILVTLSAVAMPAALIWARGEFSESQ